MKPGLIACSGLRSISVRPGSRYTHDPYLPRDPTNWSLQTEAAPVPGHLHPDDFTDASSNVLDSGHEHASDREIAGSLDLKHASSKGPRLGQSTIPVCKPRGIKGGFGQFPLWHDFLWLSSGLT